MLGLMQDFPFVIPRLLDQAWNLNSHVAMKALPLGSTGMRRISQLREQFKDIALAGA